MRQGKPLDELARELMRQNNSKQDYVANTNAMMVTTDKTSEGQPADTRLTLASKQNQNVGSFPLRENAHRQIRERMRQAYGIRQGDFYDQIRAKEPAVFDDMVNRMLFRLSEERMVRTLDYADGKGQTARAFLSNRYRRLDNFDLAQTVLPIVADYKGGGLRVESSEVTESHLYLKFVYPGIERRVAKVGDVVQAGVVVQNSEVGDGAISVAPMVFTLRCTNGMVLPTYGTRRNHVGGRLSSDEAYEIYTDETLQADDKAFWLKIRDSVRGALTDSVFDKILARINATTERRIEGDLNESVKLLGKRFPQLTEADQGGILGHLARGGEPTQYSLFNAVTRHSQDVADYDKATDLERVGAQIIDLSDSEWRVISDTEHRPVTVAV